MDWLFEYAEGHGYQTRTHSVTGVTVMPSCEGM
jgi:hypothetical protein